MRQLLQSFRRLAVCGDPLLVWGHSRNAGALLPACAAAQVQLRWRLGAAGGSAAADAGTEPCGAAERTPSQETEWHPPRQASGAAASTSIKYVGSGRRGMHSRAAGDGTATEHAGATPAGPVLTTLAASVGSRRHSMHTGVPASAAAAEPAPALANAAAAGPASPPRLTPGTVQNAPKPPWTPTRELQKRNFLPRRMGFMIKVGQAAWPVTSLAAPLACRISPSRVAGCYGHCSLHRYLLPGTCKPALC